MIKSTGVKLYVQWSPTTFLAFNTNHFSTLRSPKIPEPSNSYYCYKAFNLTNIEVNETTHNITWEGGSSGQVENYCQMMRLFNNLHDLHWDSRLSDNTVTFSWNNIST